MTGDHHPGRVPVALHGNGDPQGPHVRRADGWYAWDPATQGYTVCVRLCAPRPATTAPCGHPLYRLRRDKRGWRVCLECHRERMARRRAA